MARPKSEDKRNAILTAAAEVFAERGLGAPTSVISKAAGIAEGTLFTYFSTKDELLNALYREIKLDLADAIMSGFPRRQSIRARLHHVWDRYVGWGVAHPIYRKALHQLEHSDRLIEEARTAGLAPFLEVQTMVIDALAQKLLQDFPEELIAASISAQAEATMDLSTRNPSLAEKYREAGFAIFWRGITRK
jgi:AcrR family transcriptional regulator